MKALLLVALAAAPLRAALPVPEPALDAAVRDQARALVVQARALLSPRLRVTRREYACDVVEPSLGVALGASFATAWIRFDGAVGAERVHLEAARVDDAKPALGWTVLGSGVALSAVPGDGGWRLFGTVDGAELNLLVVPFAKGLAVGPSLRGAPIKGGVELIGLVDARRYPPKALAALGAALGAVVLPAR